MTSHYWFLHLLDYVFFFQIRKEFITTFHLGKIENLAAKRDSEMSQETHNQTVTTKQVAAANAGGGGNRIAPINDETQQASSSKY